MWKRIQGHVRDKERQIGNPVLLETTYDEDQLRHIPSVSDARNASNQPSFQSQPYSTQSPHDPRDYWASAAPTVPSAYSQSPPEGRADYHYAENTPSPGADISPPSSPEPDDQQQDPSQPRRFRSMRDVSPVDENRGQRAMRSNIPVLRKAPPSLRDGTPPTTQKFWEGKVAPDSNVLWDEYSGEPNNAGRPGQVNPHAFAREVTLPPTDQRPMGYEVSVRGPRPVAKKTFAERASRIGTKPSAVNTTIPRPREPWKGASGRAEIVQPFRDQRAKQSPLEFQRKPEPKPSGRYSDVGAVPRDLVSPDTAPVADPSEFDDPIKPIVPLKVGRNSPPRSIASPTSPFPVNLPLATPSSMRISSANQAIYSYPSPITPSNSQPSATKPSDREDFSVQEPSTPANVKVARKSVENTPGSTGSKGNGPTSRFSWTTYNTSTSYQHSPPPSPVPPLPTATPALDHQPLPTAPSLLVNRRRPIPGADKTPARKPIATTPNSALHLASMTSTNPPSPRPISTLTTTTTNTTNTQKALPRPPTEISAEDHIDVLEAQMEDLRIRRSNVHRLLQDLNNRAPPNPLITDFKRMRLVDKSKKEFEDEMAEIRREEHDVGLKLHRAWRKRERADPGSESAIWIRRVTR